jgi:2-dehydro-3-deoxyglucarate aldolase/4-hydroxy-2-oxoheptanedioate aldolase
MMKGDAEKLCATLRNGGRASAAWLQGAHAISAEIVANAGFDIAMVDLEHGPGDILSTIAQIQAMQGSQAVPFARAPWNDFVQIKRILDSGVMGLLVPYVNTAEEAAAAISACKYPTHGVRGVAGSPRAAGYGQDSMEYLTKANDTIFVMTAVETPLAVQNLDSILTVPGLDGIFIGPMDLATSMGCFANPSAPQVQDAIKQIETKVLAAGKVLATVAGSWEQAQVKYERGYRLVVFFSDTVSLGAAAREAMGKYRNWSEKSA